jgi:hypothetical protein
LPPSLQKPNLQITLVPRLRNKKAKRNFFRDVEQPLLCITLGMVYTGCSTKLFSGVGLAVPRLGNVRLRLHFLRRGTSGGPVQNNTINLFVLGAESKKVYNYNSNGTVYAFPLHLFLNIQPR